jgi:exodeoxyribonuclease VII small subunit
MKSFADSEQPDDEPELAFETALGRLEKIVAELERGQPDLATALAGYETGLRLLNHCHAVLDRAERSVAILTGVDAEGNPHAEPFDASATDKR